MKCVITGGGTGGHLAIARALMEALVAVGDTAVFIGSTTGQDQMWFADATGFEQAHFLSTTGVVNRRGAARLVSLFKVLAATRRARKILKQFSPDAVISVGGFSAAPASFAALSLRIPFYIHEQNAVLGRLNRLLRSRARAVFSSYLADSPVKSYPVNQSLFGTARLRNRVGTVIFLGGSQGAKAINDFALDVAVLLHKGGVRIIHQCGENDFERVRAAYASLGVPVALYGFTRELPALLAQSDLAVSRAGASTLWELAANGLPALYVPYPHAAADHQYYNALFLAERGLAWLKRETELVAADLEQRLSDGVSEASRGLLALPREDGAVKIMAYIKEQKNVS